MRPVEFTRVLHVPDPGSNLLSVLYLVRQHQFHVHIDSNRMAFALKGQTLFTAPIDRSNTAYLSGTVVPSQSALVSASSTLPLDETLWHRRFAHLHHTGIERLISESLVTGMKLQLTSKVDPICEPSLASSMLLLSLLRPLERSGRLPSSTPMFMGLYLSVLHQGTGIGPPSLMLISS